MATTPHGIQLVGFSRKGTFFEHIPAEDQQDSLGLEAAAAMESTPQKSGKTDSKRGKSLLSSGRSKVRDIFRRFESRESGSPDQNGDRTSQSEFFTGSSGNVSVASDQTECSAKSSTRSSMVSLDPEDIQEFDEEGRRVITLSLDKPKDRGSKLLNALKTAVPKISPLKKRDSVVSIGSVKEQEEEEDERPCFSPETRHFIPYTSGSGMEHSMDYNSEDSDSEYCYSGMLNFVQPADGGGQEEVKEVKVVKGQEGGAEVKVGAMTSDTKEESVNTDLDDVKAKTNVRKEQDQGQYLPSQGHHNNNDKLADHESLANTSSESIKYVSSPEILQDSLRNYEPSPHFGVRKGMGELNGIKRQKLEVISVIKESDEDNDENDLESMAEFDPNCPIRISLTSENNDDSDNDTDNKRSKENDDDSPPQKLNVIDYTRPMLYLVCEPSPTPALPVQKIPPKVPPKPKVSPKSKKKALRVKFSDQVEERRDDEGEKEERIEGGDIEERREGEMHVQRREKGEAKERSSTMSLEQTIQLGDEETEEKEKVCHHDNCAAENGGQPLLLCESCDDDVHGNTDTAGHLRFDVLKRASLNRNVSTRSLPGLSKSDAEDEGGGEEEEEMPTDQDMVDGDGDKVNLKLKRKKALKGRRHHTADDCSIPQHMRSRSVPVKSYKSRSHEELLDLTNSKKDKHNNLNDEIQDTISGFNKMIDSYSSQSDEPTNHNDSDSSDLANHKADDGQEAESKQYANEGAGQGKYANEDGKFGSWLANNTSVDESDGFVKKNNAKRKTTVKTSNSSAKRKEGIVKKCSMNQEYCTLKFDVLNEPNVYEVVEVTRGVSLRDAIAGALQRRGIAIDGVSVYLASSNTPLPLVCDSYPLGGNHLHIKASKGDELPRMLSGRSVSSGSLAPKAKPTSQKDKKVDQKLAGSQRSNKKLLDAENHSGGGPGASGPGGTDTSPHGTLTTADSQKLKGQKGQAKGPFSTLFSPFSKTEGKHEQLAEELNQYSLNGLPQMPGLLALGQKEYPEDLFELEKHWSHLINVDQTELSKKQKDQQEAIWELLHTEVEFIRRLTVILDLFQCCLINLQNELLLNEIETEKVFGNVRDIYTANAEFWERSLVKVVQHSRKEHCFLDPSLLKDGFMQFEETFHPYTKYCLEQKTCLEYIKIKEKENDLFKTFIVWAEAQKQCKRLKLQDLIISPMQRLTKYKLLLKAILKKTDDDEHRKDLILMIEKVDRFVLQVNAVMHQKAEQERLSVIIDRIEAYDVIDAPNEECIKLSSEFCKFDLTCPVPGCGPQQKRHLLLEGGLKLKDSISKMDVYCFLFTDMLLVTKPNRRGDKVKVTKPPMRLDKVVVTLLKDTMSFMLVYLNEYNVASAIYTFHGESAKVWVDHVKRSQDAYRTMRTSAMEHTETRLMYLDMYDDTYEEDFAIFNHTGSRFDLSPEAMAAAIAAGGVNRMDSHGSADTYMPTLQLPRSTSHDALRSAEKHQRLTSSASLDEAAIAASMGKDDRRRPKSMTFGERRSRSPRPNLTLPRVGSSEEVQPSSPKVEHHQTSKSAGLHPEYAFFDGKPPIKAKPTLGVTKSEPPSNPPEMDEVLRSKLNQRRTRTEKRYHTADAIQELRREPDASIHKRLSWNLGTVDINIEDQQRGTGGMTKGKTFSSDSLRSMPSSSGVSSTGSLHLSPDTEISEEYENEAGELVNNMSPSSSFSSHSRSGSSSGGGGGGIPYSQSDSQILIMNTSMTESSTDHDPITTNSIDQRPSNDLHAPPLPSSQPPNLPDTQNSLSISLIETSNSTTATTENKDHLALSEQSSKEFSKSLPDISLVNLVNRDCKDGIASVEVQGVDGQKRKMTHGEILRMKKQLLLNSTLEASEV